MLTIQTLVIRECKHCNGPTKQDMTTEIMGGHTTKGTRCRRCYLFNAHGSDSAFVIYERKGWG